MPSSDPIPSPQPSTASAAPAPPQTGSATAAAEQHHADPDEVDISNAEHYYAPGATHRVPPASLNDDQLRQMMLGFDPPTNTTSSANGAPPAANPFAAMMGMAGNNPNEGGPDPEDPMMKMLSQILGGSGGGDTQNNPFAAMQQQQQTQPPPATTSTIAAAVWRVLHFLVAASLGLYLALLTRFTGTKVERERGAFAYTTGQQGDDSSGRSEDLYRAYFFWAFATAESVLLTSRFFFDQGARGPSGMVATVLGFVPAGPWKSLVVNGLQYVQILGTVRMDLLVCVFMLGVCSLLQG